MSPEAAGAQAPSLVVEPSTSTSHFLEADDNAQNGNLEKTRDILFGAQVRDHDRASPRLNTILSKRPHRLEPN